MLKILSSILLAFCIVGCNSLLVPETGNQVQVHTYSQFIDLSRDVTSACKEKIIEKEMCIQIRDKLKTAKILIDNKQGAEVVADIFEYVESKL